MFRSSTINCPRSLIIAHCGSDSREPFLRFTIAVLDNTEGIHLLSIGILSTTTVENANILDHVHSTTTAESASKSIHISRCHLHLNDKVTISQIDKISTTVKSSNHCLTGAVRSVLEIRPLLGLVDHHGTRHGELVGQIIVKQDH